MTRPNTLAAALCLWALTSVPAPAALPATGVTFATADEQLQRLYDRAVTLAAGNVVPFGATQILVEGGGYRDCWLETQPMGGEMYAARNVQVALNNQLIFLQTQRRDGRLPGMVSTQQHDGVAVCAAGTVVAEAWFPELRVSGHYGWFQGFCFPEPAWRMYFWAGKDKVYLQHLYDGLAAFDAYLWRTRDSNGDGVLETWCLWDTGEDGSTRLVTRNAPTEWPFDLPPGHPGTPDPAIPENLKNYWGDVADQHLPPISRADVRVPFASMDVMGYSYDARATLAKISRELDNGKEASWTQQAEDVRQTLIAKLWDAPRHACFDRDKDGRQMPELIHNNLRAMYHGIFTPAMAEAFIHHHLLNPHEFWTPLPLPSIAANEPLYRSENGNSWSGQPEGLTYQRAIRALENYGRYALVTALGTRLLDAIERGGNRFTQQFDPLTALPSSPHQNGYGPTILAALEYLSRMHGIHPEVVAGRVWWSACDMTDFHSTQRWGDRTWSLTASRGVMTAESNGNNRFTCSTACRVVTDLDGQVLEVVGITATPQAVTLKLADRTLDLTVQPDQSIRVRQ